MFCQKGPREFSTPGPIRSLIRPRHWWRHVENTVTQTHEIRAQVWFRVFGFRSGRFWTFSTMRSRPECPRPQFSRTTVFKFPVYENGPRTVSETFFFGNPRKGCLILVHQPWVLYEFSFRHKISVERVRNSGLLRHSACNNFRRENLTVWRAWVYG